MRKLLLYIFLLLICPKVYSQDQHLLDSLFTVLKNTKEDSARVELLITICGEKWKYAEYAEAKKYADSALSISQKINFTKGIADANNQIGIVYWYLNENQNALTYHLKALDIYEKTGNKKGISEALNRIGHAYADMPNYPKSLEYFQKALQLDEQLNDSLGISKNLDLIGFIYMHLEDYSQALAYYFQSLNIAESIGNKRSIGAVCHDIGVVYEKQNNLNEALNYAKRGLANAQQVGEKHLLDEAYSGLEKIYMRMGNYKDAYSARLRYDTLEYDLRNADNAGTIKRIQMQYDFEKKEATIKAEQEKNDIQQRNIRNSILAGLGAMFIFSLVVYRQRNHIRKGKKRSDELLLNILPAETAEELKSTGEAKAKTFDEVTVLFTDFKDFTQTSEKLSAENLVKEINYCYSQFDKIISKYGIEKIKTIGDSYMCAGGLPVPNKTNPIDVVNAGLEMQQFIEKNKVERIARGETYFELRLGIHTGPVVAGIVGIRKFAYDIWGDTVNIASRMESSGEVGKVNISGAT
ncbi:MAG: adenylate/guanylate cyclase domain-containing protein, partial [Chitinophagales bacterium]